ncbi:hypothetical protein FGO68_gene6213 [Halteria grandinella]|uniref:Uncharacterized protein n=1 Tax=Halteria grandinella TaxID=5974 RepID=A0A8J8T8T5_HALGN|nr:hypothetical protein FGO68_gene6213 [Halteria grandinella]
MQPTLLELFAFICKNMLELRKLYFNMPNEGSSQFIVKYQQQLLMRTLPLQVRIGLIQTFSYTYHNLSTKYTGISKQHAAK